MKSKFVLDIRERERLFQRIRVCVDAQKECSTPDAAVDEFVKTANHYRMLILNMPRDIYHKIDANRRVNYSMAVEIAGLSELLASKIQAFESRLLKVNAGIREEQEVGLFNCVLWCASDQAGSCVCNNSIRAGELIGFSKNLQMVVEDIYGVDDVVFERKIREIYGDMLFDLLKISFNNGLRVVAYNDISKYGKGDRSMFHAFVEIFDYCEYPGDVLNFTWREVLSKQGVESFSRTLAVRLNDIKNGKIKLIKNQDFCVEEVGLNFYKFIECHLDGVRINSYLPNFKNG